MRSGWGVAPRGRRGGPLRSLTDAGRIGIGHEEPDVVAEIGERRFLLQIKEHVAEDARAARVESVDGERPDVWVLHEIAANA